MKKVKEDTRTQVAFLQEMLNSIRLDDPKVRLFIEEQTGNNRKSGTQGEIASQIIKRLKNQNRRLLEQLASLKNQLKETRAGQDENQKRESEKQELDKILSDALGSCEKCWGEDSACTNCSGNGASGWRKINKQLFNTYILPTLEKLRGLTS